MDYEIRRRIPTEDKPRIGLRRVDYGRMWVVCYPLEPNLRDHYEEYDGALAYREAVKTNQRFMENE